MNTAPAVVNTGQTQALLNNAWGNVEEERSPPCHDQCKEDNVDIDFKQETQKELLYSGINKYRARDNRLVDILHLVEERRHQTERILFGVLCTGGLSLWSAEESWHTTTHADIKVPAD